VAICWKAFKDTDHRSEEADKRRGGTDRRQTAQTALQLGVDNRFGPLECALARFDLLLGDCAAAAVVAELLQAGSDDFSKMGFLVAVGNLDRFVKLAFLQRAGNAGSELARLLLGGTEVEGAVDDHSQRPDGHDEQDDDHAFGEVAHVVPEVERAEANWCGSWKKLRVAGCTAI
jgi:hypothetical protein